MDEAARATMGTRKATEAFSTTSNTNYNQNKFSIAEIPTFSQIKESGVREKLRSGFTSIHVILCAVSPLEARFFLDILPVTQYL